MEINELLIYWITRLDAIKDGFTLLTFICIVVLLVCIIYFICVLTYIADHGNDSTSKKKIRNCAIFTTTSTLFLVLTVFMNCLIPTSKEMCVIVGVPKIIKTAKDFGVGEKVEKLWKCLENKIGIQN